MRDLVDVEPLRRQVETRCSRPVSRAGTRRRGRPVRPRTRPARRPPRRATARAPHSRAAAAAAGSSGTASASATVGRPAEGEPGPGQVERRTVAGEQRPPPPAGTPAPVRAAELARQPQRPAQRRRRHPSRAAARPARRPAPGPRRRGRARPAPGPPARARAPTPGWRCRSGRRARSSCVEGLRGPALLEQQPGRAPGAAAGRPRRSGAAPERPPGWPSAASRSPRSRWMPSVNAAAYVADTGEMPHMRCCSVASATDCSASSSRPWRHWAKPAPQVDRQRGEQAAGRVGAGPGPVPEVAEVGVGQQQHVGGDDPQQHVVDGQQPVALEREPRELDRAAPGPPRRAAARRPASPRACGRRRPSPLDLRGRARPVQRRSAGRACTR